MTVVTHGRAGRSYPGVAAGSDLLGVTDAFGSLDDDARMRLVGQAERVCVPGGTAIMRQGEPGDAMWLVVNGRLGVSVAAPGGEVRIGEVGRGQLVGELALLSDRPRNATVRALRDSELLRFSAAAFRQLVSAHPEVLLKLSATLIERMGPPQVTAGTRPTVATIAVLPAGSTKSADVAGFCRRLADALAGSGAVRHLRAGDLSHVGDPQDTAAVVAWLQRIEEDHDFVIYEASDHGSEWSARCVRQADRVLVVGRAGADPAVTPDEGRSSGGDAGTPRRDLVLLHTNGSRLPAHTAAWLGPRHITAHHHVREDGAADYQRLARVIAGKAVGVVLGGGGARGLAHLGVLRAIEEAGIPIDAVGGTSIGAIMAATFAVGWDHETRVARAMASFAGSRFLLGFTFPAVATSSSKKLTNLLRHPDYLGETPIEDMWTPFFCVSTSLSRAEIVVHDTGPAWWGVRASIALPGILPPVWHDGDLLVDGGVLDDLPIDVMRSRHDGPVVAVDLRPEHQHHERGAFEPALSGWSVLGRRLNPFSASPDLPGALAIVSRAKDISVRWAQRDRDAANDADLYLRPPTDGYGTFDFKAAARLIDLGYRYASRRLEGEPWSS